MVQASPRASRSRCEQETLAQRGASIECRIYAEDPSTNFMPSPGTLRALRTPAGPWVRDDSGFYEGATVPSNYDPLVSKLSVWAPDRPAALRRMRRALSEYVVTGIRTNLVFHEKLLAHPEFAAGRYHTGFIEQHAAELLGYTDSTGPRERARSGDPRRRHRHRGRPGRKRRRSRRRPGVRVPGPPLALGTPAPQQHSALEPARLAAAGAADRLGCASAGAADRLGCASAGAG